MKGGQNLEMYAFEDRQNASSGYSEISTAVTVSLGQLLQSGSAADVFAAAGNPATGLINVEMVLNTNAT